MFKKLSFAVVITVVFAAIVVTFEVIHRQTDQELPTVNNEYLQPINITLKNKFMEKLDERSEESLSDDLIY